MTRSERGAPALLRLLDSKLHDLREQTPESFGRWLERHLRGWAVDPVFQQRVQIREIRRANPTLQLLERERHSARAAYEVSPGFGSLEQRRRELAGGENAVAGLEHALERATQDDERFRLRAKLVSYRSMVGDLRSELERLQGTSQEWQALHEAATRLAELRTITGFDREAARLVELQRSRGRSSGRSGSAFELSAASAVRAEVFADLGRSQDTSRIRILQGVRLGSAKAEFDHLVVELPTDPAAPVRVLAAAEAKRNINDLAHGLRNRVDNLNWFSGTGEGYDPEPHRTSAFPTGHFDRSSTHTDRDGQRYVFTRESFDLFLESPPVPGDGVRLPRRLYLISRPGWLWGIGSGGLARIAHRASSDVDFDLRDPDYLTSLLAWSKGLTHRVETPDLLRHFAWNEDDASRVLLLSVE